MILCIIYQNTHRTCFSNYLSFDSIITYKLSLCLILDRSEVLSCLQYANSECQKGGGDTAPILQHTTLLQFMCSYDGEIGKRSFLGQRSYIACKRRFTITYYIFYILYSVCMSLWWWVIYIYIM